MKRLLDVALPILYAIAVVTVSMTDGRTGLVAVVGAMILALYYAAVRRVLP